MGWLLAAWRGRCKELARARAQFALQLGEWQERYREAKAAQAEAESRQLAAEGNLAAEAGKSAAQRAAIEALQSQLDAAQAAGGPIKGYASRDEARKAAAAILADRWTLEWDPGSADGG